MNKKQDNLDYAVGYGKNYANLRKKEYNHTNTDYTVRELSKELLIASSTISKIEKENVFPTVEQVKAYKNFFHVSLDYLTGETKAMKPDIQMICSYTGLSEEAVETLHNYCKRLDLVADELYYDVISDILSFEDFYKKVIGKTVTLKLSKINPNPTEKDICELNELLAGKEEVIHNAGMALVKGELVTEAIKSDFGKIIDNILDTDIPEDK